MPKPKTPSLPLIVVLVIACAFLFASNIQQFTTVESPLVLENGIIKCPACSPKATGTRGGIIGGTITGAGTTGAPFASQGTTTGWLFPVTSGYLYQMSFCRSAANPDQGNSHMKWRKGAGPSVNLVDDFMLLISAPAAAALPCESNTFTTFPILRYEMPEVLIVENFSAANIRGWSAVFYGSAVQPMGLVATTAQSLASETQFISMGQRISDVDEVDRLMPIPFATTLDNFCLATTTAQPASGTFVITVRDSQVGTAVAITLAASAPVGNYCTTGTHAFVAGDTISIGLVNNATAASANIGSFSWTFTATGRAMLIFPFGTEILTASADNFGGAFNTGARTAIEADSRTPMPVGGTLQTFYCYITTAPATNDIVTTVYRNGAAGAVTLTITPGGGTGVKLGTGTQAYVATDSFNINHAAGAGTVGKISGCAAAYVY